MTWRRRNLRPRLDRLTPQPAGRGGDLSDLLGEHRDAGCGAGTNERFGGFAESEEGSFDVGACPEPPRRCPARSRKGARRAPMHPRQSTGVVRRPGGCRGHRSAQGPDTASSTPRSMTAAASPTRRSSTTRPRRPQRGSGHGPPSGTTRSASPHSWSSPTTGRATDPACGTWHARRPAPP